MVLTSNRLENSNIGYVCGNGDVGWGNECGIRRTFDIPALEGVRELIVLSLGGLVGVGRLLVVVYFLSTENVVLALPGNSVLAGNWLKYSNVGYIFSNWGRIRINQFVTAVLYLPTNKFVVELRSRLLLRGEGLFRRLVVGNLLITEFFALALPSYRVLIRIPLCVQMQVGHQKMIRANFILGIVNIPATEAESGRDGEHVIKNGMCLTAHCSNFAGIVGHAGDSTIVRMISNLNRNTGYIAVNMIAVYLLLNGVPYNSNIIHIKVFAQNRGIGRAVIVGTVAPVARSKETEVFRKIQIFAFNANVINLGITVRGIVDAVMLISNLLALRGQMAFVAGEIGASGNAAVRSLIRQVACWALAFAARRLITVWQKYEVLGFRLPIPCEVDLGLLQANCIRRRIAYYIIILRIVFRSFGNGGIGVIARLRAVRTAVCAVVGRSRCGILILGRLCLGLRRSGISGSFGGVCFNGSGLCYGKTFVHEWQSCDVLIVGQRPARAHGQHHDSRKSSCEQTFARILF